MDHIRDEIKMKNERIAHYCRVLVSLKTPPPTSTQQPSGIAEEGLLKVANELSIQRQHQTQPHLAFLSNLELERQSIMKISKDELKSMFFEAAKHRRLSADEVMQGYYLLYASEAEQQYFFTVMMRMDIQQRVLRHNAFIASRLGANFIFLNGSIIASERMAWPLFPHTPEFTTINDELFDEVREYVLHPPPPSGGRPQREGQHKNPVPSPTLFKKKVPVGGEYYVPVQHSGDGRPFVDLSVVESSYDALQRRLDEALATTRELRAALDQRNGDAEQRFGWQGARRRGGRGRGRGNPDFGQQQDYRSWNQRAQGGEAAADAAHPPAPTPAARPAGPPPPEPSRERRSGF